MKPRKTHAEIEAEVRERLKDLPNGSYQLGKKGDKIIAYTGKQGYINYMVQVEIALYDMFFDVPTTPWTPKHPMETPPGKTLANVVSDLYKIPKFPYNVFPDSLKQRWQNPFFSLSSPKKPIDERLAKDWQDEADKCKNGTTLADGTYISGLQYWQMNHMGLDKEKQYFGSIDPALPEGITINKVVSGEGIMKQIERISYNKNPLTKETFYKMMQDMAKYFKPQPIVLYRGLASYALEDFYFAKPDGLKTWTYHPKKGYMVYISLFTKAGMYKVKVNLKHPKIFNLYHGTNLIGVYKDPRLLFRYDFKHK